MAEHSTIEWTDATWNPVTGCAVVSPGCTNCYAMKLAGTRLQHHPSRAGLTTPSKAGPVWNGQVRFNAEWLDQPLRWKRPRRIFVCAHGDLFAEGVPDAWIDQVFAVMALAPQHTFQVLTKRPARMRQYLAAKPFTFLDRIAAASQALDPVWGLIQASFPLPNVWLGVSVEDQARADLRIPDLMETPAAVRFLSIEPMLGEIDLQRVANPAFNGARTACLKPASPYAKSFAWPQAIDWVIVGGESGQGARPMHPAWPLLIRDQCAVARVPFFFKQWGSWAPRTWGMLASGVVDATGSGQPFVAWPDGSIAHGHADDHGGPGIMLHEVGKHAAGRLLDGAEHNGMPT